MEAVTSGCITQMVDSTSVTLLAELEQKRKRMRSWPIVMGFSFGTLVVLFGFGASVWITIPLAAVLLAGTFLAYQRDIIEKSVVMMYDLDDDSAGAYRRLYDAAAALARCGATWHVSARGDVYDPKYHAGAGQLVTRQCIHVAQHAPPFVRTNLSINRLPLGNKSLYFFPDRVLIYAPNGIGAISYVDLRFGLDSNRFIEDGNVPRDAQVVDRTWKYVNKSGGPDRRFRDNRELPVCLYEQIRLHSDSGLNELLQVSRMGVGSELAKSVAAMASAIGAARHIERPPERETMHVGKDVRPVKEKQSVTSPQTPSMVELYETLFKVICCVMVVDGRASGSEKTKISQLMRWVQAPWTPETIENRISAFITEVQTLGYNRVMSDTLARVPCFKQIGRQDVLLTCIDSLASADGKLDPKEQALCQRIRDAVA